ncbi:MAG: HAD hydrolase family protein [Methanotrichaceae archaeon]|nr:HAD hydrolase family protein [Methanotrichaceae archaeon]
MIADMFKKYDNHARIILNEKKGEDSIYLPEIAKALSDSYERIYHAVALDIDGTIKKSRDDNIPTNVLETIAKVIKSGAYVLFVTGSGKSTVEKTLNQVKNALPKSQYLYRKVYAIDGNGCRLFFIDKSGNIKCRSILEPLKRIIGKEYEDLLNNIKDNLGGYFEIQEKECGIRLISNSSASERDLSKIISSWYKKIDQKYRQHGIKVVSSRWGNKITYDISNADKDHALSWFYTEFDFIDVPILRIGDQGKENGNDFTFLDSPYGFSVGTLSSKLTKCFPIYDSKSDKIYKDTDGTRFLLSSLKWGPRLTIPSSLVLEFSEEYCHTCDKLRTKTEHNSLEMLRLWLKGARPFFPNDIRRACKETEFNNLFDHKSGSIRLSDSEWQSLDHIPDEAAVLAEFFTEKDDNISKDGKYPGLIRSLFTDTGIILRGPRYYIGLSEKPSREQMEIILDDYCNMLNKIAKMDLVQTSLELPNKTKRFTAWKINLALLDNFRNSSLLLYNMLFQAASLNTSSRPYWKRILKDFEQYVALCIDIYYSIFMLDVRKYHDSIKSLNSSMTSFYDLKYNINLLYNFLESNGIPTDKIIRKWREVDHPGQIFSAINSIKNESTKLLREESNICALGLMYGGIELPFAFRSFFGKEYYNHIKIAGVMGISFYGQNKGSIITRQYSRDILESSIPSAERLEDLIAPGETAIIFDDNIMTGRTIELARDRLQTYGVKVPFALCVRFPHENRICQMKMKHHGGVDPSAMGKDIKGLVAQSPYSRIFTSTEGYKDVTGVFDLSRQRIVKYLKKNGLTIEEDT